MRRLVIGLVMVALLTPRMSMAQQTGRSAGSELGLGVAAPILNVVYFPVKLAVGIVGGILGGISGWATGGDERAAESIWRPTIDGTYFITPAMLDGQEPFQPFGGGATPPPSGIVSSGTIDQP